MMRAEYDPEAEHVQTSNASDQDLLSITWLERSTTVTVPSGHSFATWPTNDLLTWRIRELITQVAQQND